MNWLKLLIPSIFSIFTKYLTVGLIILLSLISLYAYYEKTRYAVAMHQIDTIKQDYALQVANRQAENTVKLNLANQQINLLTKLHLDQLNSVKGQYEKTNKLSNITISNLRNELRDKINSDSIGLPEIASDSVRSSTEWKSSYSTLAKQYETLIAGCKITTSDYNLLREYSDNNCLIFGCK